MGVILFALGSAAVWWVFLAVYHGSMALVARRCGIAVREVKIGAGPTLVTRRWFGGELWRFKLLPLGGYNKFYSTEEDDEELDADESFPPGGAFDTSPLTSRLLVMLVGPISVLLIGLTLLSIPVLAGHAQLTLSSADEAQPAPIHVAGLAYQAQSSSLEGQLRFCLDTAGYYLWRVITFQPLEGWGGWIALMTACGQVGAHSWLDWLTLIGVVAVAMGCWNLVPLPLLNGFQIVSALIGSVFGKAHLPGAIWLPLTYAALLAYVIWYGRVIWLDARWVWAAVSG